LQWPVGLQLQFNLSPR